MGRIDTGTLQVYAFVRDPMRDAVNRPIVYRVTSISEAAADALFREFARVNEKLGELYAVWKPEMVVL